MKRTKLEFNGDIAHFTQNTIVAADGSSQKSNATSVANM